MLDNLKNEMDSFYKDLDENIKNEDEREYIKIRTSELIEAVIDEIDDLVNLKEETLKEILRKQEQDDRKIQELQKRIDYVYQDIYEDEDDFTIECPYCNTEFDAYVDEDLTEIRCPECSNLIELDWSGNIDDDDDHGDCNGNCNHCGGCE